MAIKIIKRNSISTKPLTLRQQNVVSLVSANVCKSQGEILRKSGYSESIARKPNKVFNSPAVKDAVDLATKKLREIRANALGALSRKSFEKESAYNLTMMVSILTKNIELLEGRPVARTQYELLDEEKAHLRKILEMNS